MLVFRLPATGTESNLQQATALARRMVTTWAMSEETGLAVYTDDGPYWGLPGARELADATAAQIDRGVRGLLDLAYERASSIRSRERPLLDALAAELLAHETVDGHRLDSLLVTHRVPAQTSNGVVHETPTGAGSGRDRPVSPG